MKAWIPAPPRQQVRPSATRDSRGGRKRARSQRLRSVSLEVGGNEFVHPWARLRDEAWTQAPSEEDEEPQGQRLPRPARKTAAPYQNPDPGSEEASSSSSKGGNSSSSGSLPLVRRRRRRSVVAPPRRRRRRRRLASPRHVSCSPPRQLHRLGRGRNDALSASATPVTRNRGGSSLPCSSRRRSSGLSTVSSATQESEDQGRSVRHRRRNPHRAARPCSLKERHARLGSEDEAVEGPETSSVRRLDPPPVLPPADQGHQEGSMVQGSTPTDGGRPFRSFIQGSTPTTDRAQDAEEEVDEATVLRTLGKSAERLNPQVRMAWFKSVRKCKGRAYDGPTQRRLFSESNQAQPRVPGPPEGLNARYLRPANLPPPRLEGTPSQIRAMGAAPLMGVAYDVDPSFDPYVTEYIDRHDRTINSTNQRTQIPYWELGPSRTIDQRLMMDRDEPGDFPIPPSQGDEVVGGASGGDGGGGASAGNAERSSETRRRSLDGWDELERSLDHPGSGLAARDGSLADEEGGTRPATRDRVNATNQPGLQSRAQGARNSANVPHGRRYLTPHRHQQESGFGPDPRRDSADHSWAQGSNGSTENLPDRHYVPHHHQQRSEFGPDPRTGPARYSRVQGSNDSTENLPDRHYVPHRHQQRSEFGPDPRTGPTGYSRAPGSNAPDRHHVTPHRQQESGFGPDSSRRLGNVSRTGQAGGGGDSFPARGTRQYSPFSIYPTLTRINGSSAGFWQGSGPGTEVRVPQVMETSRRHPQNFPAMFQSLAYRPASDASQWEAGSVAATDPASIVWFDDRPPSSQVTEDSRHLGDGPFHPSDPLQYSLPHRPGNPHPVGRGDHGHGHGGRNRGGHGHARGDHGRVDGGHGGRGGHGSHSGRGGHGLGHGRGGSARPDPPQRQAPNLVLDEHGHTVSRNLMEYRDEAEKDPFEELW